MLLFAFGPAQPASLALRYSKVRALRDELLRLGGPAARALPPFPPKFVLRNTTPRLLRHRGEALARYLTAVFSSEPLLRHPTVRHLRDAVAATAIAASTSVAARPATTTDDTAAGTTAVATTPNAIAGATASVLTRGRSSKASMQASTDSTAGAQGPSAKR